MPKWIFSLKNEYIELFSEVYGAFNAKAFRLAMIGARTILDMFIVDKVGDIKGTFKAKLAKLQNEHFINSDQKFFLETAIDAGSASAHRGYKPTEDVLFAVIDIVEHMMQSYPILNKLEKIKNHTPPRNISS